MSFDDLKNMTYDEIIAETKKNWHLPFVEADMQLLWDCHEMRLEIEMMQACYNMSTPGEYREELGDRIDDKIDEFSEQVSRLTGIDEIDIYEGDDNRVYVQKEDDTIEYMFSKNEEESSWNVFFFEDDKLIPYGFNYYLKKKKFFPTFNLDEEDLTLEGKSSFTPW